MRTVILAATAALLTGCVSPENPVDKLDPSITVTSLLPILTETETPPPE